MVDTFWLFWIMQLWIFMCNFLCGHTFSFLLGLCLGVELQGHTVTPRLTFWGTVRGTSYIAFPNFVFWKFPITGNRENTVTSTPYSSSRFNNYQPFVSLDSSACPSPLCFPAKELEASLNTSFYVVNLAKRSFASNHPFRSPTPTPLCGWNLGRMQESKRVSSGSVWGGKGIASEWNRTGDIICKMKMWSPLFKN